MSNIILGLCANYSTEQLAPFAKSLRETDFRGEVTLFVDRLSDATLAFLHAHDFRTIPFRQIRYFRGSQTVRRVLARSFRLLWSRSSPPPAVRRLVMRLWQCAAARFFAYETYLQELDGQFDKVMLTDVRDVVFQRDPFDFPMTGSLCAFQESLNRIGDDYFNSRWIKESFGRAAFTQLCEYPVFCSGVTLGTAAGVANYLETMTRHLLPRVGLIGYDQGVHNFLVHTGALPDLTRYENWNGPVLTLGTIDPAVVHFSPEGLLKNRNGDIINVIHQYDRQPTLAPRVLERIGRGDPKPALVS
jgi:hypothetical protein